MSEASSKDTITLTIEVEKEALVWVVRHLNDFIASKPVNTEYLAHRFVSALTQSEAWGADRGIDEP
jgi:hypothetical protein